MARRGITSLLILMVWLTATPLAAKPVEEGGYSERFDRYFKKYAKRYFGPYFDWRWFKSQGIAESNLKVGAVSPVGAKGIMQIMPETFAELKKKNPHFTHLTDPNWNIAAGIFYDRQLYRRWRQPLPSEERLLLAFASYNAGYNRVRKSSRRVGKNDFRWTEIKQYLPRETRGYVDRISELMNVMQRHRKKRLRGLARIRAESG